MTSGSERLLGFHAAIAAAGLTDSAIVRVSESWSAESAEQAATELLGAREVRRRSSPEATRSHWAS